MIDLLCALIILYIANYSKVKKMAGVMHKMMQQAPELFWNGKVLENASRKEHSLWSSHTNLGFKFENLIFYLRKRSKFRCISPVIIEKTYLKVFWAEGIRFTQDFDSLCSMEDATSRPN